MKKFSVGDVLVGLTGRDKDELMLVIDTNEKFVYLVDGSIRKTVKPKKKNVKHVQMVESAADVLLAERIKEGLPVSDKRVRRSLVSVKEKFRR